MPIFLHSTFQVQNKLQAVAYAKANADAYYAASGAYPYAAGLGYAAYAAYGAYPYARVAATGQHRQYFDLTDLTSSY